MTFDFLGRLRRAAPTNDKTRIGTREFVRSTRRTNPERHKRPRTKYDDIRIVTREVVRSTVLLFAGMAYAASAGSRGAVFLTLPPSPRAAGAAEALTAVGSDPGSVWINPAALARQAWPEASAAHQVWIGDLGYQALAYAQPVPRLRGAAAMHLLALSKTGIPSYDVSGIRTGDVSVWSGSAGLAYARAVTPTVSLGGRLKAVRESLADVAALAGAADLGVRLALPWDGAALGASLLHVGTRMKFAESTDLPLQGRLHGGLRPRDGMWAAGMDVALPAAGQASVGLGAEYRMAEPLTVRAGWRNAPAGGAGAGISAGLTLTLGSLMVDYAYGGWGSLGTAHFVGVGYRFGRAFQEELRRESLLALYRQGRRAESRGDAPTAARRYEDVLAFLPDHAGAKAGLGRMRALQHHEKLEAWLAEAQASKHRGDLVSARDRCRDILALVPEEPRAAALLGEVNSLIGSYTESMGYFLQGVSLYEKGEDEEAIGRWRKIPSGDAVYADAQANIRMAQERIAASSLKGWMDQAQRLAAEEKWAEAVPVLEKALEVDFQNQEAQDMLAKARRESARARELGAHRADVLYEEGLAAYTTGRAATAVAKWEEALRLAPDHARARKAVERVRAGVPPDAP